MTNKPIPTSSLRILFMGTSAFAVPSLRALHAAKYPIVGVFTAPDKPQGRGRKIQPCPVGEYAAAHALPLYQPPRLRAPEVQHLLQTLRPNLQVVVAFRKLPESVWGFPNLGSINLHASLLPAYRGAAPIHWAIIQGERITGLSTFFITKDIDMGPLLLQEEVPIAPDDTAGSLQDRMSQQGADLLLRTIDTLAAGQLQSHAQPPTPLHTPTAPKLHRSSCEINWHQPAERILYFVRGLTPQPGAWTPFRGQPTKIFHLRVVENPPLPAGKQLLSKTGLFFGTTTETLSVEYLQLPGKTRLPISDFLRGLHL